MESKDQRDAVEPADQLSSRVLGIAAREFAELGVEGVSMRVLADKCEVSTTWLYYHFTSKEALFKESCSHAIEETFRAVLRRLKAFEASERRPELIITAFFDEWVADRTTLLLVERDVISALLSPERWLTGSAYHNTLELMKRLYVSYLGSEPDEDFAFAFASFMYGFCSLMIIDERALSSGGTPTAADHAAFVARKRESIARFAQQMIAGRSARTSV